MTLFKQRSRESSRLFSLPPGPIPERTVSPSNIIQSVFVEPFSTCGTNHIAKLMQSDDAGQWI